MVVILAGDLTSLGVCTKNAVPNSAEAEIVIGIMDDLNEPVAGTFIDLVQGQLDVICYISEEKRGVLGHPLRAIVIDHKVVPP